MATPLGFRVRGFTLIEMLVVMAIFSAVMLIATLSYSGFAQLWSQREARISVGLERVVEQELLRRSVEGAYDYYVESTETDDRRPYFRGADDHVRYITQSSYFLPGSAALVELRFLDGRLLYREWPLRDDYVRDTEDTPEGPGYSRVIWSSVEDARFEYFGYPDLDALITSVGAGRNDADPRAWFTDYDALARRLLPQQLRITVIDEYADSRVLQYQLRSWNPAKAGFFVEQFL